MRSSRKKHPVDPGDTFIPGYEEIVPKEPPRKRNRLDGAIWTHRKALLIEVYLKLFVCITFRGTYIDAFAGPQDEKGDSETWAAKKIWQNNPGPQKKRITRFELFEKNKKSFEHLQTMIDATRKDRRKVHMIRGDCNATLPKRLEESPVSGPAFCLLDQRSDECHWDTVKAIANHKSDPTKIELFYFVMAGWLDRYRAGLSTNRDKKLLKFWGHPDFTPIEKASPERAAELFSKRFQDELGYKFASFYPIYDNLHLSDKGTVKFYMIHATDHDEAPLLMDRAYKKLATGWNPKAQQNEMGFLDQDLMAMLSEVKSWDQHISDEEKIKRRNRRHKKR